MNEVTTMRFLVDGNDTEERDSLVAVEVADADVERGIDVHLSPRTDEVETFALSAPEAWQLARHLARAATSLEAAHDA